MDSIDDARVNAAVSEAVGSVTGRPASAHTRIDSLKLDSVDMVAIAVEIGERLGLDVADIADATEQSATVGDLVARLEEALRRVR